MIVIHRCVVRMIVKHVYILLIVVYERHKFLMVFDITSDGKILLV